MDRQRRHDAPVLVGAGGHFCPVAREAERPALDRSALVAAQEAEFPLDDEAAEACAIEPRDAGAVLLPRLKGYGWCFRKGDISTSASAVSTADLDVGARRVRGVPEDAAPRPRRPPIRWRGHAYLVAQPPRRTWSTA